MDYYIDINESKQEKQSNGKYATLYRCGCKICDKCWFRPDCGICIYGGPYRRYEEEIE